MALGWNEIKERAIRFSKEWENGGNEDADAIRIPRFSKSRIRRYAVEILTSRIRATSGASTMGFEYR